MMAIRNWDFLSGRQMDFSSLEVNGHMPSDIDMFFVGKNKFLILGEIKHIHGRFKDGQRHLLESLMDRYEGDGIILFITHETYVENGERTVDVGECFVAEYYLHLHDHRPLKKWIVPQRPLKVKEVIWKYGK